MKLEPLFEMELDYEGGFFVLAAHGEQEGVGYGDGRGRVSGDRLSGSVRWSNHPTGVKTVSSSPTPTA